MRPGPTSDNAPRGEAIDREAKVLSPSEALERLCKNFVFIYRLIRTLEKKGKCVDSFKGSELRVIIMCVMKTDLLEHNQDPEKHSRKWIVPAGDYIEIIAGEKHIREVSNKILRKLQDDDKMYPPF